MAMAAGKEDTFIDELETDETSPESVPIVKENLEEMLTKESDPMEFTFRCLECNYRATDKEGITNHVKDLHKK